MFPFESTSHACAEPGAVLCAWPLAHSGSQMSKCVATTIVQAYSLPLHHLKVDF